MVKKGHSKECSFFARFPRVCAAAPENQKNIQDDLSAYCFGDFYTRKFLPTSSASADVLDPRFSGRLRRAGQGPRRRNATVGNGKEVLLAALTVCLPYIGFPRTLNVLSCINEVLPEAKQ